MDRSRKPAGLRRRVAGIVAALSVFTPTLIALQSQTANAIAVCDNGVAAQNNIKVAPSHGQVFYIDTGVTPVLDSGYVGYRVTNAAASARSDLWVRLSNFTGGRVGLVNSLDETFQISSLGATGTASATKASYFLLKASSATTVAQTHTVSVYQGNPSLAASSLLYSCTYTFTKVRETIKAAANKLADNNSDGVAVKVSDTTPELGQLVTLTAEGATGTIGNGTAPEFSTLWFAPVAVSTWPTRALRLEGVSIIFDGNKNWSSSGDQVTYTDQIYISAASASALPANVNTSEYRATYTFRVIGRPIGTVQAAPVAQITSGSQVKHTDTSTAVTNLTFSSFAVNASLDKTIPTSSSLTETACAAGSCSSWGGSDGSIYLQVPYRLTASLAAGSQNTTIDKLVDTPPAGAFFKPGSATITDVNNASATAISDPTYLSSESGLSPRPLHFTGPFVASTTRTVVLNYTLYIPKVAGTYVNSAYAQIGDTRVGATASAMPQVTVTTNGTSTVGVVDTVNSTLPVDAQTSPASSITTTSATLNGVIDPNGTTPLTAQFEYGTSPTLSGATTVAATTPASGTVSGLTDPTNVSYSLTGLSTGTTYYYRVKAGSVSGTITSFTTVAVVATPTVSTDNASPTSSTAATLNGTINPNLTAIGAVQFVWASNSSLTGATTITLADPDQTTGWLQPAGSTPQQLSTNITGLTFGNTYYYKFVACPNASGTNPTISCGSGSISGSVVSFTTTAAPTVATSTLPNGLKNTAYSTTLAGAGGSGSYSTWALASGSLPSGLTLNTSTGVISGTAPNTASTSTSNITVTVTDSLGVVSVAKSLSITVVSSQSAQTITFAKPADRVFSADTFNVSPTSTSGLPVTVTSTTTPVCTADVDPNGGYFITMLTTGTCSLTASQAGDSAYTAASAVPQSFEITKTPQNVTWVHDNKTFGDAKFTVVPTSDADENPSKSYSSSTTSVCTIDGSTGEITIVSVGTCTVSASLGATTRYNSASKSSSFTVAKKNQTVTWSHASKTFGDAKFTVVPSTDADENPSKTYSTSTPLVCSIDASTGEITIIKAGDCTVGASLATTTRYNATTASSTFNIAKKNQTIGFSQSGKTYGESAFTVSASTDADGGSFTYSSQTPLKCTVSGATVSIIAAGDCTLRANHNGSNNYNTGQQDVTFAIAKKNQTISFSQSGKTYGESAFAVSASTDADGGSFTYSSQTTGICTVSGATVTLVSAGDCTLRADHNGSDNYNSGQRDVTFAVGKKSQSVTWSHSGKTYGDPNFTVVPSTDADEAPSKSYSSSTTSICTIDPSTGEITILKSGDCTVSASLGTTTRYTAASVNSTFAIAKKNPTVSFAPAGKTYGAAGYSLASVSEAATTDSDVSSIVYSTSTSAVCDVTSSGTVTIKDVGTCTLSAYHNSSDKYAAGLSTKSFTVSPRNQTISWDGAVMGATYHDDDFDPKGSSDASIDGGAVSYTIDASTSTVCSIVGGKVRVLTAGNCKVNATHPGNGRWNAGSGTKTFTIAKKNQTVSFAPSSKSISAGTYDASVDVATDADGSGTYTFTEGTGNDSNVCTVTSQGVVTLKAVGTCSIKATHGGNDNWNSGNKTSSFAITSKLDQTINFAPGGKTYGDSDFDVEATTNAETQGAQAASNATTYTSLTPLVCEVKGGTVRTIKILGAGTCTLNVQHPGNSNYNSGAKNASFAVAKKNQTPSFSQANKTFQDANFNVAAATNAGVGGAFSYSTSSAACSVTSAGEVTILDVGNCTINASHSGDDNWNTASTSVTFAIGKKNQTVTWSHSGKTYGDVNFTVVPSTNADETPGKTYSSSTPLVCTIDSSTGEITIVKAGDCTVSSNLATTTRFNSASSSSTFTIAKKNQTQTFTQAGKKYGEAAFNAAASTNATGGGSFTYTSSTTSICEVTSSGAVTLKDVGNCTLTASHPGNGNWNNGSASVTFAVGKGDQVANIAAAASRKYGDPDLDPDGSSSGSNDGGAITYTIDSSSSAVCSVVGGKVRFLSPGNCLVQASHPGNAKWNSATAQKTFVVGKGDPTITFDPSVAGKTFGDDDFDPIATASAATDGGSVTYAVDPSASSVCSIVGGKVRILTAGDCKVVASHPGNTKWNSASQVKTFSVGKKGQAIGFALDDKTLGDDDFDVAAKPTTNASGGGNFTFASTTAAVCTVTSAGVVSLKDVGTCTIEATHPGNANWNGAVKAASFKVNPKPTTPSSGTSTTTTAPTQPPCAKPVFDVPDSVPALQDAEFSWTPTIKSGTSTLKWTVVTGALPSGLSLSETTGAISGKPLTPGDYAFSIGVTTTGCSGDPKNGSIDVKMAIEQTGTVAGVLWFDINKNDKREKNEPLLPGATVNLNPQGAVVAQSVRTFTGVRTTVTDKKGAYLFTAVPLGEHEVTVVVPKTLGIAGSWEPDGKPDFKVPVQVTKDSEVDVDLAIAGTTKSAGTAINVNSGTLLAKAPVTCKWAGIDGELGTDDDVEFETTTADDGTYVFDGIPVGKYSCSTFDKAVGKASQTATVQVTEAAASVSTEKLKRTILRVQTKGAIPVTGTDADLHVRLALLLVLMGSGLVLVGGVRGRRRRLDLGS